MKCRHYFDAKIILKTASNFCDAILCIEQIMKRRIAHHNDNSRLHDSDLPQQKRTACMRLWKRRRAIARRTTAVDVADKNLFAFESDAFDDLCQQLSRTSDKGKSLFVLIRAWRLADKHQI